MEVFSPEELRQMDIDSHEIRQGGMQAFKVILRRLDAAADKMAAEYDACDFAKQPEDAIRIQMYRRIVKKEIPRMVDNLLHHNNPAPQSWNFWDWLKKSVRS